MFSEGSTLLSVSDMAHFEGDIMPSKGSSMLSEGGSVPYEVVVWTGEGSTYFQRTVSCLQRVAGRLILEARYLFWRWCHRFIVRHGTFGRAA